MKEDKDNFLVVVEKAKQRLSAGESPEDVFDHCYDFQEGFASIELNDKWNFIDHNCNYISDTWFDDCWNFNNGLARVKLNGSIYLLRKNGVLCDFDTKEPVKMEE